MAQKKIPSEAQAKLIARRWAGPKHVVSSVGVLDPNATVAACIRNGWLEATEDTGFYPSGQAFSIYQLSDKALDALEDHLRKRRMG